MLIFRYFILDIILNRIFFNFFYGKFHYYFKEIQQISVYQSVSYCRNTKNHKEYYKQLYANKFEQPRRNRQVSRNIPPTKLNQEGTYLKEEEIDLHLNRLI